MGRREEEEDGEGVVERASRVATGGQGAGGQGDEEEWDGADGGMDTVDDDDRDLCKDGRDESESVAAGRGEGNEAGPSGVRCVLATY